MPQISAAGTATCRNCRTALSGAYCHACGQQFYEGETLRKRLAQALTSIATPGGRFFESVIGLLASPGDLTRAYNAGQRQRFISPLAMLLFAMLMLHGVQWLVGGPDQALSHEQAVTSALERADQSLSAYAEGKTSGSANGPAVLRGAEQAARSALPEEERHERALSTQFFTDQARQAWNPAAEKPNEFSRGEAFTEAAKALPGLFPILGWLMIPLLLPAMITLFRSEGPGGTLHHARFLAHMIAFGALAFAAGTTLIVGGASWLLVTSVFALALTIHTAFHLRGAYGLSWTQTVWRTATLLVASVAALLALIAGVAPLMPRAF